MSKKKTPSNVVPIRPDVKIPTKCKILPFVAPTALDIDPDEVLKGGLGKFEGVVVVGECDDGSIYYASSSGYLPNVLWLLSRAVHEVHSQADANDDDDGGPEPLLAG